MNTSIEGSVSPLSDDFLRTILDQTKEFAVIGMDARGVIVSWNAGAQHLFGFSAEEAVGKHGKVLFTREDNEAQIPEKELEDAIRVGQASDERWHSRKDGSLFWGSGVMTALRQRDDTLKGFAKIVLDRTARKLAEEKLEEMNRSLEERVAEGAQKLKGLFADLVDTEQRERQRIASLLHDDLQQVLVATNFRLSSAHLIAISLAHGELISSLNAVREHVDAAIEITRTLSIDLVPPVLKGEDFGILADWLAIKTSEAHGLTLSVESDGDLKIPEEHVRIMLMQVLRELLLNIIKHAEAREARIVLKGEPDWLSISIEDKGKGFDTHATLSSNLEGKSFGLFDVIHRIEIAGGTLNIDSQPGAGTRITIKFPRKQTQDPL